MVSIAPSLLVICSLVSSEKESLRTDWLFRSWQKSQQKVRSLEVTWTQTNRDIVFETSESFEGKVRFLRTTTGDVYGSCTRAQVNGKNKGAELELALLWKNTAYLLDHNTKTATRFNLAKGDLLRFLSEGFNPLLILLDEKRAKKVSEMQLTKRDKPDTYLLTIKPKKGARDRWSYGINRGGLLLMDKPSENIPKHMPRRIWVKAPNRDEITYEIKSWKLNPANPPTVKDFTRPEDRPGWKVLDLTGLFQNDLRAE